MCEYLLNCKEQMKTHQQLLLKLATILFFVVGGLFPVALASIGLLNKSHGYQRIVVKKDSALNKYVLIRSSQ